MRDDLLADNLRAEGLFAEARLGAYLEAALDSVIMVDASGCVVEFNAAAERTFGYTREQAIGSPLAELIVPPSLREGHRRAFARFIETGEETLFGQRLELTGMRADGSEFPVELTISLVRSEPPLVCGALRDLTKAKRAEEDLRTLADEQAALRRVATLVARGAPPNDVFAAVAEGVGSVLRVPAISMIRFEADGTATKIAGWGKSPFPTGAHWTLDDPSVMASVMQTGRSARIDDYAALHGAQAAAVRQQGIRSGVGVPIIVDGRNWGVIVAFSTDPEPLSVDAEDRLARFTELVATAIANTAARDDLRRLADEQAALRRVATLVASGAGADEIFARVAEEVARVFDAPMIGMARYEPDGMATLLGAWGSDEPLFTVGTRLPLHPGLWAEVRRTGRPARVESYADLADSIADELDAAGIRGGVAVPVVVDGEIWGVVSALSTDEKTLPDEIEARLAAFTELVATAISNTQTRDDLRQLAQEQAALRRVAVLVAKGSPPDAVFAAVAQEVAQLLEVPAISMVRFEPDQTSTAIAVWGDENPFGVGATFDPWPGVMLQVRETGAPARLEDFTYSTGPTTARLQAARIHSGVGVPINVEGRVWGTIIALAPGGGTVAAGIEARLSKFTELVATAVANTEARDDLRRLADEQAALRRVATVVAQGAEPGAVFDLVCAETGPLFGATSTNLAHFTEDGFNLTMSGWSLHDTHVPTGTRLPLEGDTINALVQHTAAPGRFDSYQGAQGELAALLRARGVSSEVGAPVIVDGRTWGALIAGWDTGEPAPVGIEHRLARFAELIATAVSNATTHSQLLASRARIVTASDEARRRIERNLHDGTQQRLVVLGLDLQALRAEVPVELSGRLGIEIERIEAELASVIDDVHEISRGVHPAVLSHSGLAAAVKALARRSPIPVVLEVQVGPRLSQSIEIAAYYVASEALANAAKHSGASSVSLSIGVSEDRLQLVIADDGIGGATIQAASGLMGLVDRVEALGGKLSLRSAPGNGTTISVDLPVAEPPAGAV